MEDGNNAWYSSPQSVLKRARLNTTHDAKFSSVPTPPIPSAYIDSVKFELVNQDKLFQRRVANITTHTQRKKNSVFPGGVLDPRLGSTSYDTVCATCGGKQTECPGHVGSMSLHLPIINADYKREIFSFLKCVCYRCGSCLWSWGLSRQNIPREERLQTISKKIGHKILYCLQCNALQPRWTMREKLHPIPVQVLTPEQEEWLTTTRDTPPTDQELTRAEDELGLMVITPHDMYDMFDSIDRHTQEVLGLSPAVRNLMWQHLVIPGNTVRPSQMPFSKRNSRSKKKNEHDLTVRLAGIAKMNAVLQKRMRNVGWDLPDGAEAQYYPPKGIVRWHCNLVVFKSASCHQRVLPSWIEQTTKESAMNPRDRYLPKRNPTALQALFDLQRSVAAYQNKKNGDPRGTFGFELASLNEAYQKSKHNRPRNNLCTKRVDHAGRTVISPLYNLHIDQIGLPRAFCRKLTYPDKVHALNAADLLRRVRKGPQCHPGANFITTLDNRKIDLRYPNRNQIDLQFGWEVERHLDNGDITLANRAPSLHKHSLMAHTIVVHDHKTINIHQAVTPPYNGDFDGDEMTVMPARSQHARAEMNTFMRPSQNLLKDGRPIIVFIQHTVAAAWLWAKDDKLPVDLAAQMLIHREDLELPAHVRWGQLALDTPEVSAKAAFEAFLPSDLWVLNHAQLSIHAGVIQRATLSKNELNGREGLLHSVVHCRGMAWAAGWLSMMYRVLQNYICWKGLSARVGNVFEWHRSEVSGLDAVKKAQAIPHLTPRQRCRLMDAKRDIAGVPRVALLEKDCVRDGFVEMIRSGAKGNAINLLRMASGMGQMYDHTGSDFATDSHDVGEWKARGNIHNNLSISLDPIEDRNKQRAARTGLVDTAVKTSDTGYMSRKIGQLLEPLVVNAHHAAVTTDGRVLQLMYGNNGFDGNWLLSRPIRIFRGQRLRLYSAACPMSCVPELQTALQDFQKLSLKYTDDDGSVFTRIWTPLDPERTAARLGKCTCVQPDALSAPEALRIVRQRLWSRLVTAASWHANIQFRVWFWDWHHPYSLAHDLRLTCCSERLTRYCDASWRKWLRALATPGELVGQMAGQMCGEAVTQMTLQTFHLGGMDTELTWGVPRLNNLIDATKSDKLKGRQCELRFRPHVQNWNLQAARLLQLRIGDLVQQTQWTASYTLVLRLDYARCAARAVTPFHVQQWLKAKDRVVSCVWAPANAWAVTLCFQPQGKEWKAVQHDIMEKQALARIRSDLWVRATQVVVVERLMTQHVRGIPGLIDYAIETRRKHVLDHFVLSSLQQRWVVFKGSAICRLMAEPSVDPASVGSNDVHEMVTVFGIGAATRRLMCEIRKVYNRNSASLGIRHIQLLASRMTQHGQYAGAKFSAIRMTNEDAVLRTTAFENPMLTLLNAALYEKTDMCTGATESVMVNKLPRLGTFTSDLVPSPLAPSPGLSPPPRCVLLYEWVPLAQEPEHLWEPYFQTRSNSVASPDTVRYPLPKKRRRKYTAKAKKQQPTHQAQQTKRNQAWKRAWNTLQAHNPTHKASTRLQATVGGYPQVWEPWEGCSHGQLVPPSKLPQFWIPWTMKQV